MYSKLTIKTSERRQWRLSVVFIVNFEHISHLVLVLLLLTLSRKMPAGILSLDDFGVLTRKGNHYGIGNQNVFL